MKYMATESVKVGPEQFALKGQVVEAEPSNEHIALLVKQGLLSVVEEPVATPTEVEVTPEPEPKAAPKGK